MDPKKRSLLITSLLTFGVALAFYVVTCDPDVSYWDCPEYVATASLLQIGHPPGNPIWMLAMRVATIPFAPEYHAYIINLCSGFLMAWAALLLAQIIFYPTSYFLQKRLGLQQNTGLFLTSVISFGGALSFALCDSVWFSAVEAEVYAMSTFLSVLSLWIMLKWWLTDNKSLQNRLLILLAYIIGISLGVHQLNLLLIPAFALIIYYRLHPEKVNAAVPIFWVLAGCGIILVILLGIMPGLLFGAGRFELWAVNGLGLANNSGIFIFILCIALLSAILFAFAGNRSPFYRGSGAPVTALWMIAFIVLGFSSFATVMIRAVSSPPINEGAPDNIFSLSSYISREQYPSPPLVYGATPYSMPLFQETFVNGSPVYNRYLLKKENPRFQPVVSGARLNYRSEMLDHEDSTFNQTALESGRGYVLSDYSFSQVLTPELNMWLPRLTSRNPSDIEAYRDWAGMTRETMNYIPVSETQDSSSNFLPRMNPSGKRADHYSYRPTYAQNLRFFLSYQAYYMYFRYLFWNFIGRQNDFPSKGEIEHGNFLTGIPAFDSRYLGVTDQIPDEIYADNKGRNRYFGIPFAIGLLGIIWLGVRSRNSRRVLAIITLIFLMTGLAIVVYLNQSPGEPRERDYTFLVSYMAFAMWIAAGATAIAALTAKMKYKWVAVLITCCFALVSPTLMAVENFDDHDRRGRFEPAFFANSMLEYELPAVIFTHGDNVTFPLWYASEVLKSGKDHTPVDVSYLSQPYYITNLKKQGAKGLTTIGSTPQLAFGAFVITRIPADSLSKPLPLAEALKGLYESDKQVPEFPTSLVKIPVNTGDSMIMNLHTLSSGSSFLSFRQLMLLDILASQTISENPKVLFIPYSTDYSFYKALRPALKPTFGGFVYAPFISDSTNYLITKRTISRELEKLPQFFREQRYIDPLIADRIRRHRGELIIAARDFLNIGDTVTSLEIAEAIALYLPYTTFLPGDFTQTDSTFYEGKEFSNLIGLLPQTEEQLTKSKEELDSLMAKRRKIWVNYYNSLPPDQRATLSNRSRRLLR